MHNLFFKTRIIDSLINGQIKVLTNRLTGRSSISVDNLHQSGYLLVSLWKKSLKKLPCLFSPDKVLLLGGGGGSLLPLIKKLYPKSIIFVVEKDPVMQVLAKELQPNFTSSIRAITEDARDYVNETKEKFDLILVDLCLGRDVPEFVYDSNFLSACGRLLNNNGKLVVNFPVFGGRLALLKNLLFTQEKENLHPLIIKTNTNYFVIYNFS